MSSRREDLIDPEDAKWLLGAAVFLGGLGYGTAAWPLLVWAGRLPSIPDGVVAGARLPWHLGDPRGAYEPELAEGLPGALGWWVTVLLGAALITGAVVLAWLRVDAWRGRRRLGARRYDPRGRVQPRAFARPRDVRHLRYRLGDDAWSLLRVDRREIGSGPQSHALAIGPSRSGKSTGLAMPWVLEAPGAVVVTSTKRELAEWTGRARSQLGPCRIYAPLTPDEALPIPGSGWSPLEGCEEWDHAQLVAHWLADGAPGAGSGGMEESAAAHFWNSEASKLLGPLFHAAALDRERWSMGSVVGWVDGGVEVMPEALATLQQGGHPHAARRLTGFLGQDTRAVSYTAMSAGQLIDAYRVVGVQETERRRTQVDVEELLAGRGTLYLLAPESRQALVAPLFAALLGDVFRRIEEHDLRHGPMDPTVRFVLDEAAHLAALSSLPERLALTAGHGARIASIWQSYAQIEQRYGKAAPTVVANSHARLALGPIVDEPTRRLLVGLLDEQPAQRRSRHGGRGPGRSVTVQETREAKASAQGLQQLQRGRALAVVGDSLPILGQVRPWEQRPHLAELVYPRERRPPTTGHGQRGGPPAAAAEGGA